LELFSLEEEAAQLPGGLFVLGLRARIGRDANSTELSRVVSV
jgi:hypothetical protein